MAEFAKSVIKNRSLVEDTWTLLTLAEGETAEGVALPAGDVIVPLAVWQARKDALLASGQRIAVWLAPNEGPEMIADDLPRLPLVAVQFPKFTDGRGYSTARLLRERYRYQGEVRAIGDVLVDQLFYMTRCGFDAFVLRADKSVESALARLDTFPEAYQTAVDRPHPLFRRRAA